MESRIQNPWVGMKRSLCGLFWAFCFSSASWWAPRLVNRSYPPILTGTPPSGEEPACQQTRIQPSGREDALVKEMGTHSSILAWIILWTEKPGGLQPTELQQSDATERRHTQVPPLVTLPADHVLPILFIYLNIPYLWKTSPMLPPLRSPSWVSLSFPESFLSLLPRLVITLCVCSQPRSTLFNLVEPASLLCPWSFPGKNTGVGCHFLLQRSSQPRDWTLISCTDRRTLYH